MLGIERIADDDLPGSISSALLKMVSVGNPLVIMADAACLLRAVGQGTLNRKRVPVESPQNDLFVRKVLAGS